MDESEEQQPITQEPISVEEQLKPEHSKPTTLNKNGLPRKPMSQAQLDRLAKAREKAAAIRKQITAKKLENKLDEINKETEPILGSKPKKEKEVEVVEEEESVEIVKEKPKPKSKGKKTKIIVEQSSDDSDEFEQNDNVVFVKRISRKKKEVPIVPIVPQEKLEEELPPPQPRPPPREELTPQQRVLKSQYESMFSGGFLNQGNMMRRHY
mgnify:CR=1 FL=1|tara:strand:+ start:50 stop:679 length:630 start_codon:yes stop_codon:yes gene_type:complete